MNPFKNIDKFVKSFTTDITNLGLSVAVIGFIICAFMVYRGAEENVPRFQKGMFWCGVGVGVIVLAKIIVGWIKAGVA